MNSNVLSYLENNFSKKLPIRFADLTFGAGGHTKSVLEAFENAHVYSTDQDSDAIKNGLELIRANKWEDRVNLYHSNFENFKDLDQVRDIKFNAIMMDLGVSSHHFDNESRGFSFRKNAELDMRMNTDSSIPKAHEFLNKLSEKELADIIYEYGEEKFSRKIARNIVEKRDTSPIKMTGELEEICFLSYPKHLRHKKTHPATKTFQALRIYVNRELEVLKESIESLFNMLSDNGLLMVISFHSLEDRIVKHKFKEVFHNNKNTAKILTKKPELPSFSELSENPRSRSAKLRVLQKLRPGGNEYGQKKNYKR